ncbi:neurosecretory protein VGF [Salmo salar]|uniref:Neurosecretory protein VGF n=1 Tax=Salmo salar TaxID=8030 RepID=A0A1S3SE90_SALSA|nr:neurosecretory protein VGF [Salmo salar]|eukprot:XP_014062666.1 PREDICTED: neurosecretory protein VGF-like isoform X2 [Salmo salar]
MMWSHFATSALILLVVLLRLTLTLPLTASVATETHSPSDSHAPSPLGLRPAEGENEGRKGGLPQRERAEEEDELFGDMDPKMLAAVLLEAMNKPHGERRNGVEDGSKEKESGKEENERERQEEEKGEEVRAALDEEGADRDRDGREELELVMAAAAAQGKEERERDEEEEEERKRAQEEEEERLTEKVTSHTTSQTIPGKEKRPPAEGERGEEVGVEEVGAREDAQQGPPTSQETQQEEEEEQLSPDEVQNLQSMLEELQNYNTANKREREAQEQRGRESRGYSQDDTDQALIHNQIKPKAKGYPRAMSKKLKWQEEMQKALNMPTYRGGNFMDDFDNLARPAAEEDDEEMLSPEEEERRAKEEQEEVRRQAMEAQRAKAEEEKLADIASDMLLQYMVKQDKGKYQNKKTLLSNAAEDKRSDEEVVSEDDDIDPQTIDKLIEISSKLHLPADDVVDIISDVEKKKKKDAPETLPWQRPQQRPLVYPAAKAVNAQPSHPRYPTLKQPLPAINPLKAWFKDKSSIKPSKQDLWIKPQQKSFRTSSNYPTYPFYQQKPYRGYYPIYFPPPKPKPRFYAKPSFMLNDLLSNSLDYDFDFPPKRRYRPWVQPRPRKPPAALRRNLYYPNYSSYPNYLLPPHPRTYNPLPVPVPMPKPRSSPPRGQVQPRHRHGYYYQAPSAPLVTRDQDYYGMQGIGMGPQQQDSNEDLENYIQQVFMKPRPRMFQ